jgi:integration host factor subunit beta
VAIPEKRVPHFKPGKALREAVDERTRQMQASGVALEPPTRKKSAP